MSPTGDSRSFFDATAQNEIGTSNDVSIIRTVVLSPDLNYIYGMSSPLSVIGNNIIR
jgi:hypothetical protein